LYVAKDDGFMDVNIKTVGRADTQETEANNLESACSNYSATRGLTGTALPAAAADAAGGVPVSDAGGLDMDALHSFAVSSAAWGSINSGVSFRGTVTADDPGVSFTIAGLAGQGVGAFTDANTPWYAYVLRDGGGAAAAPQGEVQKVTGYTSATGLFTTDAFTVAVATGDDIVIVSAALINSLSIKTRVELALPNAAPDAAGGLPTTTKITDARLAVLTDWIDGERLDLLLDAIPTTPMRGTDSAALASVCTEARLAELAAANLPADVDTLLTRITAAVALASVCTETRLAELDAANLPTDVANVKADTAATLADTGTDGVVLASNAITAAKIAADAIGASELAADAANEVADALLDRANGIETGYTLRQALRLILSASAAKLSGAATTNVKIRDVGDSKDRIDATVDSDGNRSAVVLDAT
jgi:hypothetical protein